MRAEYSALFLHAPMPPKNQLETKTTANNRILSMNGSQASRHTLDSILGLKTLTLVVTKNDRLQ